MQRLLGWLRVLGVRGWQLAGVGAGTFVLWTAYQRLRLLVLTVVIALLLAALLLPVARWFEGLGLGRTLASVVTVVGGVLLTLALLVGLGTRLASQVPELGSEFAQVRDQLEGTLGALPLDLGDGGAMVERVVTWAQGHVRSLAGRAVTVLGLLGALLTALVVAFFLIRDADSIATWLLDRLVPDEQRELVAAAGRRAGDTLRGYVQGVIIIGGLDAILIGIVLLVLDVPLAVPLAVLTFLGGFFPVVGATVAGGLAALVALVSGGWVQGLVVAGATVAIQQIDGNLLQPVIMGRAVNLHPLVILLVLTAGGLLAGIAGAFLAVPVTAAAAAIGNEVRLRRDEEAVEARTAEAQPAPG